jgi:hypothetical protein
MNDKKQMRHWVTSPKPRIPPLLNAPVELPTNSTKKTLIPSTT